ncbi:MAG: hypothetical protein RBG13Loki_0745 [Promethearchaeota archaeon CR_4]|nr:MAG: hypothetical protein RBG13Loki_0745 [Candidatus Lokiarchaeota archaeon CR_4]
MMQQIISLLHSTLLSERRNGLKLLASYLRDAVDESTSQLQVSILVGDALREQNNLIQQSALELLFNDFTKIKFESNHLLVPLLDIFKDGNPGTHSLIVGILVKILESNLYPPRELIQKFFGSTAQEEKLNGWRLGDFLQVLCQVSSVHGDTKRMYFDLFFNVDNIPTQFPTDLITKVQVIVGTHFWNLEHQRKVRQVEISPLGITFPVEEELLPQFRTFITALTHAAIKSTLDPEILDEVLRSFPPFRLDQCLTPFFFTEVTSVTKHRLRADVDEIEIVGILKTVLPVTFLLIGAESTTFSPKDMVSNVNSSGEFHINVRTRKTHQNYIPFTFYVDILGKQVQLTVPFMMPAPDDPVVHTNIYVGAEKAVLVPVGMNGEYLQAICIACGRQNAFRIEEIANPAPLYCKSCGVLLKRYGELHLI